VSAAGFDADSALAPATPLTLADAGTTVVSVAETTPRKLVSYQLSNSAPHSVRQRDNYNLKSYRGGSRNLRNGQWRRNEFESGGQDSGGTDPPEYFIFLVLPFSFLTLQLVQLIVLVSAFVTVRQLAQFLVCFSTHGVPVPSHL